MKSSVTASGVDGYSRLVQQLRAELGCVDVAPVADLIVASEAADFHWEARIGERYLGEYFGLDDREGELSRVAIISAMAGRFHAGTCLVDGEGCVVELLWLRSFDRRDEAEIVFARAH